MNELEKEYGVARIQRMERTKRIQKIVLMVSVVSFFSSTFLGVSKLFRSSLYREPSASNPVAASPGAMLVSQEQGYELVLQREAENQTALEGLANVRLQMNNPKGAIAPLETLVKLHPDRADYKTLLAQTKQAAMGQK